MEYEKTMTETNHSYLDAEEWIIMEMEALRKEVDALRAENAILRAGVVHSQPSSSIETSSLQGSVFCMLEDTGNTIWFRQNDANVWHDSPLKRINDLKADFSGKCGEVFMEKLCLAANIPIETTGDVNSKDGTYDQKILHKKIEIKTARLGNEKFQHESLKMDGCDHWLFLDITPNHLYITILPRFNLNERHPITQTKPTLRKGTTDVFKWDFTEKHIQLFMANGFAIKINKDTEIDEVAQFIRRSLE
jgi:hypothetical protein